MTSGELLRETGAALDTARTTGGTVVVNDRVDVALAAGAHGVHLGQGDLDPARARLLLGPEAMIGWSTHDLGQGLEARRLGVDYVAVGPVSATTSKDRPDPVVPPWLPAALRGALGVPLVAIGGIRSESARLYLARGASSVAVISDLLREGDPERGVARFLEAVGGA
jgi:thiamine-phosphate pyrophosphorylase